MMLFTNQILWNFWCVCPVYKAKLFAVREEQRCSSRTTARSFAKGSAVVRERQIKTTSRNIETDVRNWKIGCTLFCCEQSRNRLYGLHHLHVNLYAVSAINRKSFMVLWCIGGHWQVKNGNTTLCHKNNIISENQHSFLVPRQPFHVQMFSSSLSSHSPNIALKHFTRIGCPAVLVVDNALIMSQKTRTTQGQPRLSLSTNWHTMCYAVQGQPDNLFRNTCFLWIPYHINSHLLGVVFFSSFCWTRITI